MDQSRFDALARALGARATRRSGLAGLLAALAAEGAAARRPGRDRGADANAPDDGAPETAGGRNECGDSRPCPGGFECRKAHRRRRCVCPSGVTCGAACCAEGETCRDGACAAPEPPACLERGEACVGTGRDCCSGLACGSGQGGMKDVACYGAAGSACASTADCTYGTSCRNGTCTVDCACEVCAGWDAEANGLSLQAAISAAAPGATIRVQAGTYASPLNRFPLAGIPDQPPAPLLLVDRSVTIAPCGDGEAAIGPMWIVGDVDVTLRGLALSGAADVPAAVSVGNEAPATPRVSIDGCTISGGAGGVLCLDSRVDIGGGTRIGGNADGGVTAVGCDLRIDGPVTVARNGGTGILVASGALRAMGDVRVVDNVGSKEPGGIFVTHGCWQTVATTCVVRMGTAHLEGTTITGNVATRESAGGIHVTGELVAVGVTVRGNWAGTDAAGSRGAGGILVERSVDCEDPSCDPGGRATLIDSVVADNRSGPDPLGAGDASAGAGGGVTLLRGGSLTLLRTTVRDNVALARRGNGDASVARGGGIAISWTDPEPMPLLTMDGDSRITGNAAEGPGAEGGGIWASADTGYTFYTVSGNAPDQCVCVTCPPP